MGKMRLALSLMAALSGIGCKEKPKPPAPIPHIQKRIEVPPRIQACIEGARRAIGRFGQDGDRLLRCAEDIADTANALAREHRDEPLLTDQIAELFRQGFHIALAASASVSTAEAGREARKLSYKMHQGLEMQEAQMADSAPRELPTIFSPSSLPPPPPPPPESPNITFPKDVVRCREYEGNEPRVLWGCARKVAGAARAYERYFREHSRDEYEYWPLREDILEELDDLYSSATFQAYDGRFAEWDELEADPAYPFVEHTVVLSPNLDNFVGDTFDNRWERVSREGLRTMDKRNAWWRCEEMNDHPDYEHDADFQFDCAQRMKTEAEKKQKRLTEKSTKWEISEAARLYHRAGTFAITASELEKDPAKSAAMTNFAGDMASQWMDLQQRLGQ